MKRVSIKIFVLALSCLFCSLHADKIDDYTDFALASNLNKTGQYELAKQKLEKIVTNRNNKKFVQACFMLANYYFESRKDVEKDRIKAVKYYNMVLKAIQSKAEAGNAEAQYITSICFKNAKYNSKIAFEWLEKSATQGYAPAQAKLAFYYMKGTGVKADFKKAVEWAEKASNQNNMLGRAILGSYYLNVKKDKSKGFTFIKQSADAGNAGGQYMLYRCLYYGKGTKKDRKKARELLQKAADQGLDDAVTKSRIINTRRKAKKKKSKSVLAKK
jgi:TPR repeat protein